MELNWFNRFVQILGKLLEVCVCIKSSDCKRVLLLLRHPVHLYPVPPGEGEEDEPGEAEDEEEGE